MFFYSLRPLSNKNLHNYQSSNKKMELFSNFPNLEVHVCCENKCIVLLKSVLNIQGNQKIVVQIVPINITTYVIESNTKLGDRRSSP